MDRLVYASEANIPGLFKFRAYRSGQDKQRVKELLAGKLYFSSRSQLNDPFEFRFKLAAESDRRMFKKGVLKRLFELAGPKISPAKRLVEAERLSNRIASNPNILDEATTKNNERMETGCFIYCFSANRNHPLLWSHYADKHEGVCIQFDETRLPFSAAAKVTYSQTYPEATYPIINALDLTTASVLTKADYWAYEDEYRLFSVRMDNPSWNLGLKWDGDHKAITNHESIVGITLGANMPDAVRTEIREYCSTHHPHIKIEQANICDDRFEIEISGR